MKSFEQENPAIHPAGRGEQFSDYTGQQSILGKHIRFQDWLLRGLLRPAWVALCGALASGGLVWATEPLLQLALLVFLVDVVWGGLWLALVETDWATPLRRWQDWDHGSPVRFLPYTLSKGPAGRLAQTCGHLHSWWDDLLQPTLGPTLIGLALLLPLALVIAGILGSRPLMLTLIAITSLQLIIAWSGGDARAVPVPQALFEIALPWLAGHALFAQYTIPSTLLAFSYALACAGALRLAQGRPGLARWNLGQIVAVIVLVASRQPVAAGVAGLLFIGQGFAQPRLFVVETGEIETVAVAPFLRFTQFWLMLAMLVAAWGCRLGIGG